jgi:hypothetical protein
MKLSFRTQSLFVLIRLADGHIPVWQLIARIGCILRWLVQDRKCSCNARRGWFRSRRQPFLMLEMHKFLRHGNIDELIQRDALFERKILGYPPHGGHEPEREFTDYAFPLIRWHDEILPF